jgi:hypothetical protein
VGQRLLLRLHLYAMYVEVSISMKKINWFAPSLLALCIASTGSLKANAHETQPAPNAAPYQDRWDATPVDYRDAQQRGFHEGVEAARHDFSEHRRADADNHQMYKHPPYEGEARKDFREGFREGYRRAMEHMMHDHDH